MLPKRQRLTAPEVRLILKESRFRRATHLSAKYRPGSEPLRVAVIVPKKVARLAVQRNRLRRAVYRALEGQAGSGTIVIMVQKTPPAPLDSAFLADVGVLLKV